MPRKHLLFSMYPYVLRGNVYPYVLMGNVYPYVLMGNVPLRTVREGSVVG